MKKFYTLFFVMAIFTGGVFAQSLGNNAINKESNSKEGFKYYQNLPLKANLSNFNFKKSSKSTASRWYDYALTMQNINFPTGNTANLNGVALFPDTTCIVKYTNGVGSPWYHAIGLSLDPTDTVFYDATTLNIHKAESNPPVPHDTTQYITYNLDSIGIPGGYFRNIKNPAIVDTLEVELISNIHHDIYHFVSPDQTSTWGAYKVYFMGFFFDANMNFIKPDSNVGYQLIKIPLTSQDSSQPTNGYFHIKEKFAGTTTPIKYGNGIVAATVRFIPGYSWQPTDSLDHLNYFYAMVYEEKGAGVNLYPRYDSLYFNQSEYLTTQSLEKGNIQGLYIPRVGYDNNFPLDNILLDLQVTVNNVGISEKQSKSISLEQNVPNPADKSTVIYYELKANNNVDFVISDMTGREIMNINKGRQNAGIHNLNLNTSNLADGLYYYTLNTDNVRLTKKMIVSR